MLFSACTRLGHAASDARRSAQRRVAAGVAVRAPAELLRPFAVFNRDGYERLKQEREGARFVFVHLGVWEFSPPAYPAAQGTRPRRSALAQRSLPRAQSLRRRRCGVSARCTSKTRDCRCCQCSIPAAASRAGQGAQPQTRRGARRSAHARRAAATLQRGVHRVVKKAPASPAVPARHFHDVPPEPVACEEPATGAHAAGTAFLAARAQGGAPAAGRAA